MRGVCKAYFSINSSISYSLQRRERERERKWVREKKTKIAKSLESLSALP